MRNMKSFTAVWLLVAAAAPLHAAEGPAVTYDAALAKSVGADEEGMRSFVFVLLKSGPVRVPDGPERDAMFQGHFANINRLAAAGQLVLAGPSDGVDGWRGIFVLVADDIESARRMVGADPVIQKGEMVAEYHRFSGSAALMLLNDLHKRIDKP